jgi:hypothetical protein
VAGVVDVEADLRRKLADSARMFVILIRRTHTTPDAAVDGLVRNAFGSPDRLRDAVDLLGEDEQAPRALLTRAVRYAQDLRAPEPPRVYERPDVSRYGGSGGSAPAPGGVTSGGGCYSGKDPRPTS